MSLAADVYYELSLVGLAPAVPFAAADAKWRECVLRAVGDSDDLQTELDASNARNERLEESRDQLRDEVRALTSDLKKMTKDRDRLAKAAAENQTVSP